MDLWKVLGGFKPDEVAGAKSFNSASVFVFIYLMLFSRVAMLQS